MCTTFKHRRAADGSVAVGRTMEFPDVMPWRLSVLASDFTGRSEAAPNGKQWTAEHGVVGIGAFKAHWIADGTNTAGLTAHLLYMPDHATYYEPRGDGSDIGMLETLAFVLGTCATVPEAKEALAGCNVVDFVPKEVPMPLPLHIIVFDEDACAVAEFHPDGMVISDNPVQVACNSPYLDWHLTNVGNYLGLRPQVPQPVEIGGTTFRPPGQGAGFSGMPADGTSPSRFIRVLADVQFAEQPKDERALLMDCVRILHNFDIVPGTIMESTPMGAMPELTMWSSVCNITGGQYMVNTTGDPLWHSIDLGATDFATTRAVDFPTDGAFTPLSV
jgi:choloylglycine hydrolase